MTDQSIGAIIRKAERDYTTGETILGKYVNFSQYENLQKIDAYLNSKFTTGAVDSLGRDKPFFNIVTGAVNIWYRATDIDRKNIRIKATSSKEYLWAFLATIHLQEWMKRESIGQFLNEWGRSLARYGSSVVKFVEKGGRLHTDVIVWNRFICDAVDFNANPKIEKLYLTPAQLRQNKAYDQKEVDKLISALKARETLDKQKRDNKNDYIEIYEIHGNLSLVHITGKEEDDDKYHQQMHVMSFVAKETRNQQGDIDFDEFTLLKGREDKDPYMITHLIKEEGRTQSIGAVEHLFEAQWMSNHTAKSIKDQLDLASKLIFQTADGSFVGQNVLSNIETGDILIHKPDMPLTQIQNNSHDITSLQNFGQQWQVLGKEIVSTPDSISGNTMPSGTAYKLNAMLNQEAHSLFEIMTENKGLHIEEMMRTYIIPFIKKKMDTANEISATLEAHDITQLDTMYIESQVVRRKNQHIKDHMLKDNGQGGEVAPPFNSDAVRSEIQGQLGQQGNQRFIKPSAVATTTWKSLFKDLEWEIECEITGEQSDKQAMLETLTTVFHDIMSNPNVLNDPNMRMLFNKILETTGALSPIELKSQPAPQPNAPTSKPPSLSINFKDAPTDVQAQMVEKGGMKMSSNASPMGGTPQLVGGGKLPVKK